MIPTPEEPTAKERFLNDAAKRAHLYTLLRDPVLAEAMDIAEDELRPRVGTAADGNQPLSIAKFHQSAGASEFRNKLGLLTREPKPVAKLTGKKLATSIDDLPKTES